MSRTPAAPALSNWSKLAVIAILATAVLAGPGAAAQEPPYPTTTSLSAPPGACDNQPVTLTATVTSDYGTPTGSVDFYSDDAGYLGSASLDSGSASLDTVLAAGARSLSATYTGNADFDSSSSSEAGCTVNAAPVIDYGPESQSVAYLDSATLSVSASGTEPLSYFWYQYDEWGPPIPIGDDSPTCTTPSISADSSFWVEVFNDCGSTVSGSATVYVNCPPMDPPDPTVPDRAESGEEYFLYWNLISPASTYYVDESLWPDFETFEHVEVYTESSSHLHAVGQYTIYYYRVMAYDYCNSYRESPWSAIRHVGVGPASQRPDDPDGDGLTTSADALMLAGYLAGSLETINNGDVSCDGAVDSLDLEYLLHFLAGDF